MVAPTPSSLPSGKERNQLKEEVRNFPDKPGAYLFKDTSGSVLYVGKAKSLKKRVSQYFDENRLEPAKVEMVSKATKIETIVTKNEVEALALEANLIKTHRPPYNVRLVDDSSYLYIKITNELYPKVQLTRKVMADGAWYRGPFPSARAVKQTLKEARKIFPWCAYENPREKHSRACFAYHIALCPGICINAISIEEYHRNFERLKKFLDGDIKEVVKSLEERMKSLSEKENYEQAAKVRDRLKDIEQTMTPQNVVSLKDESADFIGLAHRGGHGQIAVIQVRHGRIIGSQIFPLMLPSKETDSSIIREFLIQYYETATDGENEIVLSEKISDEDSLKELMKEKQQKEIAITVSERGWRKKILDLAKTNASEALTRSETELESPSNLKKSLEDLAKYLGLPSIPQRIECYDISNIQGKMATASMIVFLNGKSAKSEYRKFKIISEGEPNDVGMMKEVLQRRLSKIIKDEKNSWPKPDLIILDGGKAQLSGGMAILEKLKLDISIVGLAKREEEIFKPNERESIILPRTSLALYLLQRIRDEAHRFTLGYHQLLRKKRMTKSALEEIPGVGPKTRKKLLRSFGSINGIKEASLEKLTEAIGSKKTAELLKSYFSSGRI